MVSLIDFIALIEQSRRSLTQTGQERLEQLAFSKQKAGKVQQEPESKQAADQVVEVPAVCCPSATA